MIITDEQDPNVRKTPSPTRGPTSPDDAGPSQPLLGSNSQQPASPSYPASSLPSGPPPAYPGYETFPQPQPELSSIPSSREKRRKKTRRTILRSLFCLVFFVILCRIFIWSRWQTAPPRYPWNEDWWPLPVPDARYRSVGCHTLSDTPEPYNMSFNLHASAKDLFLVSRGGKLGGTVTLEYDPTLRDQVLVDVHTGALSGQERESLADTMFCAFAAGDVARGIVITSRGSILPFKKRIPLDIVVTLPSFSAKSAPNLLVNVLSQSIHTNVPDRINLNQVKLSTLQAPIIATSMSGVSISAQTTNEPIQGTFIGSEKIELANKNGLVHATVVARNNNKGEKTLVRIATDKQPILATLALEATTPTGWGGQFDVLLETADANLFVGHSSMPFKAELELKAVTTNGPATVALGAAYEGPFAVSTSRAMPIVQQVNDRDPSGRTRPRTITRDKRVSTITGSAYWGKNGPSTSNSSVIVKTTNNPAILYL